MTLMLKYWHFQRQRKMINNIAKLKFEKYHKILQNHQHSNIKKKMFDVFNSCNVQLTARQHHVANKHNEQNAKNTLNLLKDTRKIVSSH